MFIGLIVYLLLILLWFSGVVVAAYHVFKYHMFGDMTIRAFEIFLGVAAVVFLFVVFFVSGLSWELAL